MSEYFRGIPRIAYEGKDSRNPLAFKYYNADEIVGGKPMREQLRFAMSYWHTLCAEGADMFGVGTADKSFGTDRSPMALARAKVEAGFELMEKLGIGFFCFHDADMAPAGRNLAETFDNLDAIGELVLAAMKRTGIRCLWGTANLFGHPRYMHGAATAPNADAFAFAAAQVKKALDLTKKFGGSGYVFWGGREGYETLLNTDVAFELDNMARLLRMAVAYGRGIGFDGDFYIEPKPREPSKHQYDFDVATAMNFLRAQGLERDFKMNVEANHATLAGHTFQHELRMAVVNGAFGSVDANQGDALLGWDTDQFPTNAYDAALCMYEIVKAGGFKKGGLNFDAKQRRGSFELEDTVLGYIAGMDTFALGLRIAQALIEDGRIDDFVASRYASYRSGIGARIAKSEASLEELARYAVGLGEVSTNVSGRQELLESVVNNVMFSL